MLKKYFLAKSGHQMGPYTVNEILEKLHAAEHAWNDYIFDEAREDWLLLLEHPLFVEKYNQGWARGAMHTESLHPFHEKKWMVQKEDKKFGPFTYLEVIQMLQERTLLEQDKLALKNKTDWRMVKEFDEFSTQKVKELIARGEQQIREVFNRRRYPRAEFAGTLIVHDNKTVFRGQSFQISAGGAGLYIPSQGLQPGQTLLLHFHPSADVPAFNAVASVVSKFQPAREMQVKPQQYGVKFTSISQTIRERIYSFTNRKKEAA